MAQGSAGNVIAAICSFFIPELVQGRLLRALMFFLATSICYGVAAGIPILFPLLFAGFIFHIWFVFDAATFTTK